MERKEGLSPIRSSSRTMIRGLPSASMTAGPSTPSRAASATSQTADRCSTPSESSHSLRISILLTIPWDWEKTLSFTTSKSFISVMPVT